MSDFYFTKTLGGSLKPLEAAGEEYVAGLGVGEVVRANCRKERNPGHHRKFFGILNLVFENQDKYLSKEGLRFAVMIAAGYAEEVRLCGTQVAFKPKSINWAKMDQTEFNDFYRCALAAIPRLLPQFDGIDLDRELSMGTAA